jgi:hypothetical protein
MLVVLELTAALFSPRVLSRKPYRYLLGTILCSVLAYSQLLYYATEIEDGFLDITNAKTYAQLKPTHRAIIWFHSWDASRIRELRFGHLSAIPHELARDPNSRC